MADEGVFGGLRAALLAERERIAERLEAVDQAEAAIGRMAAAFGMPANGDTGAVERDVPLTGTETPPTPTSPAAAPTSSKQSASRRCEQCGARFAPARQGGQAQKFCSKRCRQRAHAKRRPPRPPNGHSADAPREGGPAVPFS